MADVDPFQFKIPDGLTLEQENYFRNLDRFLKALWLRTGGGDDLIEKSDIALARAPFIAHSHDLQDIDRLHIGTGAPGLEVGIDDDFYFRLDGGSNTRIYHREAGTWTALTA